MVAGEHRVNVLHHQVMLEHVQNDRRIFGVVLIPRVEPRFPISRLRHRGDQHDVNPCLHESVRDRSVVVPRTLQRSSPGAPGVRQFEAKNPGFWPLARIAP